MKRIHKWAIATSTEEHFNVHPLNTSLPANEGVAIVCFQGANDWCPLYVTQTESLDYFVRRNSSLLHKLQARGASHIHFAEISDREQRFNIERGLIDHLQPPFNCLQAAA